MWPERHPGLRGSRILSSPDRGRAVIPVRATPALSRFANREAAACPGRQRPHGSPMGHGLGRSSEPGRAMCRARSIGRCFALYAGSLVSWRWRPRPRHWPTMASRRSSPRACMSAAWARSGSISPTAGSPRFSPSSRRLAQLWREMIQPYFLQQPVWLVLGIAGATLLWAKEESTERTQRKTETVRALKPAQARAVTRGSASRSAFKPRWTLRGAIPTASR